MKKFAMVTLALVLTASMMTACRRGTTDTTEDTAPSGTQPSQATQSTTPSAKPDMEPMPSVDMTSPEATNPTSETDPSDMSSPEAHPGPRPDRAMHPGPGPPEKR